MLFLSASKYIIHFVWQNRFCKYIYIHPFFSYFLSQTFSLDINYLVLNHYFIMLSAFAYFMDIPV